MIKPELLSPAGDFECLEAAVAYGADAVYLGGKMFSMRGSPKNFGAQELDSAIKYAHARGVRIYLTVNILPRNDEISLLPPFLEQAAAAGVDAFIVSDLGVMELIRRHAPNVEMHASTQTGIVNYAAACALHSMGVKRAVLARELSFEEIAGIRCNTPRTLEIEAFVHGAMCVSFSGRCLLSQYLTSRDPNRGLCAQPCRWSYALCEQTRPGQYFPIEEEDGGTYIMNARDLCMIEHIPALVDAGITSLKIEGRAKSAYYVAAVTNAYRMAIDAYMSGKAFDLQLKDEVEKVSHRGYCTGFYYGPIEKGQIYHGSAYTRGWDIVAKAVGCENGVIACRQRNAFCINDTLEIIEPGKIGVPVSIEAMLDENYSPIKSADRPDALVYLKIGRDVINGAIFRKVTD